MADFIPLKLSVTTDYLFKSNEKYVLIDTGYKEDWNLFLKRLKEADVKTSDIGYVILTHHHDDHCGLLNLLIKENPSIRVAMSPDCAELIKKGQNDITHGGFYLNKRIAFLVRYKQFYVSLVLHHKVDKANNLKFEPYYFRENDILLMDGTRLKSEGIPLNAMVINTPGHTVDSISILFDNGDCFVGDAAASMLQIAGTHHCVIFICNLDEYYHSWEKMIKKGAKKIFPAHGKPFSIKTLKKNLYKNKHHSLVACQ